MNIQNKIINLVTEYGYKYSNNAIEKIVDTWSENKGDLISLLSKHPNWDAENYCIVLTENFERKINPEQSRLFGRWLNKASRYFEGNRFVLPEEIREHYGDNETIFIPWVVYDFFELLDLHASTFVTSDLAYKMNEIMPSLKIREGMKTSRAMNKLLCAMGYDKIPGLEREYNQQFALYADSLSPITFDRKVIISVNPLDYLTMSFGNSWASCHTIDKKNLRGMPNNYSGCYSSGTISYMLDRTSFVVYTIDSNYKGNNYASQPKITRQMFHYCDGKLIQGRLYPQDNDGDDKSYVPYRNIIQKTIAGCLGEPNRWTLRKNCAMEDHTITEGSHYPDYVRYSGPTMSTLNCIDNAMEDVIVCIGHAPICIECGYAHCNEECINCCHLPSSGICYCCGSTLDGEPYEYNGETYCSCCAFTCECCGDVELYDYSCRTTTNDLICRTCARTSSRYVWCPYCDRYEYDDCVTYVDSVNNYVCEDCIAEYFTYCECCEEYFEDNRTVFVNDYGNVCENCLEENFTECPSCGEYAHNDNFEFNDGGDCVCHSCASNSEVA